MPMPSTLAVCQRDLFTAEDALAKRYDEITVARVLRIRDMYRWRNANPEAADRRFVEEMMTRYDISQSSAYSDMAIVKQLMPMLNSSTKAYKLWQANEMLMKTFRKAELRNNLKVMAQVAIGFGKLNGLEKEDEQTVPYDEIVPQPFTATDDPTVLGITPTPNIQEKIRQMIAKYRAETMDIEDVEFEDVDLEEDELFGDDDEDFDDGEAEEEDIL